MEGAETFLLWEGPTDDRDHDRGEERGEGRNRCRGAGRFRSRHRAPAVPLVDISAAPPVAVPALRTMDLAREHGPAFVQRLHGRDTLVVSGLELVEELADETRFTKSIGLALENVRQFTGDGLFTAYNEEPNWARAHDILMPAFALGSMRTYHPVMLRVARRLIDSWDGRPPPGCRWTCPAT